MAARGALDRVAKSRLLGNFAGPPAECMGAARGSGEAVGAAVRTRLGGRPVFGFPGHRLDVASAVRLTLACTDRYRLPEPSRAAHRLASER